MLIDLDHWPLTCLCQWGRPKGNTSPELLAKWWLRELLLVLVLRIELKEQPSLRLTDLISLHLTHVDSPSKAGCLATPIDKPLATKEADNADACPGALAPKPPPPTRLSAFHFANSLTSFYFFCRCVPDPDRLNLSLAAVFGMCLHRRAFANTAVSREMRFLCYHYLGRERKPHLTPSERFAALPPSFASSQREHV